MSHYINISLDLSLIGKDSLDLRVPTDMTLQELLISVLETYPLDVTVTNPIARHMKTGQVLSGFQQLACLTNGSLLRLDNL